MVHDITPMEENRGGHAEITPLSSTLPGRTLPTPGCYLIWTEQKKSELETAEDEKARRLETEGARDFVSEIDQLIHQGDGVLPTTAQLSQVISPRP